MKENGHTPKWYPPTNCLPPKTTIHPARVTVISLGQTNTCPQKNTILLLLLQSSNRWGLLFIFPLTTTIRRGGGGLWIKYWWDVNLFHGLGPNIPGGKGGGMEYGEGGGRGWIGNGKEGVKWTGCPVNCSFYRRKKRTMLEGGGRTGYETGNS